MYVTTKLAPAASLLELLLFGDLLVGLQRTSARDELNIVKVDAIRLSHLANSVQRDGERESSYQLEARYVSDDILAQKDE